MARFNPRTRQIASARQNLRKKIDPGGELSDRKISARLRAVRTSWLIVLFMTPFWFLLLISWAFSVVGIVAASVTIFGFQLIGNDAAMIFLIFTGLLHCLSLIIALTMFWVMRVECTTTWPMIVFGVMIGVSFIPGIQIVPWVMLYCFLIVLLQTGQKSPW